MILAINSGSSSIKASLFADERVDLTLKELHSASAKLQVNSKSSTPEGPLSIEEGFKLLFRTLKKEFRNEFDSISRVAHRFVHGGEKFQSTIEITSSVLKELESLKDWAPLHNESCFKGIEASIKEFGTGIKQFVVFDTSFFAKMPAVSSYYAIPLELANEIGIKRYGFHGISHQFLWNRFNEVSGKNKAITLHLGNGCSMAAIDKGRPLDTSMGLTPNEGLVMGTRSGDIDPEIVEILLKNGQSTPHKATLFLNKECGLLGVSGRSSNMEELLKNKDSSSKLAVEMFCYRIEKYLGAYMAVLEGADALIFSGGIGENSAFIRDRIIQKGAWMGWKLDPRINESCLLNPGEAKQINSANSSIEIYVIATDENLSIAHEGLKQ